MGSKRPEPRGHTLDSALLRGGACGAPEFDNKWSPWGTVNSAQMPASRAWSPASPNPSPGALPGPSPGLPHFIITSAGISGDLTRRSGQGHSLSRLPLAASTSYAMVGLLARGQLLQEAVVPRWQGSRAFLHPHHLFSRRLARSSRV